MNNGEMASGKNLKNSLNNTNRSTMARKLPPSPVQYLSAQEPPFKRDMEAARNGFSEEFPLLCALFGASIIPQVMIADPQSKKLVPLPPKSGKEIPMEKITPLQTNRETDSEESLPGSLTTETHAASHIEPYNKDEKFPISQPFVEVSFDDPETQEGLNKFVMKGYPVDKAFIKALGTILKWYEGIQVLVLKDCNMTAELVELLVQYLADSQVVVDLTLDGNPVHQQNYSSLLHAKTGLRRLSLANCKINDLGAEKLAKEIAYRPPPWKDTLVTLDLRGNEIGDKGMESIANALRTNRTIREIIVPRNAIRDAGAVALATALQKFPLRPEDLANREKESHMSNSKNGKNITAHRATLETLAPSSLIKRKYEETSPPEQLGNKKRKKVVYKYHHPYVWDVRPEGLDLWCTGNLNLEHIDLAHNNITETGAKKFAEAIEYQARMKEGEYKEVKGITSLKLQGNLIPENSYELDKIDELLSVDLRKKYPPKRHVPKKPPSPVKPQTSYRSVKKYTCFKSSPSSGTADKSPTFAGVLSCRIPAENGNVNQIVYENKSEHICKETLKTESNKVKKRSRKSDN